MLHLTNRLQKLITVCTILILLGYIANAYLEGNIRSWVDVIRQICFAAVIWFVLVLLASRGTQLREMELEARRQVKQQAIEHLDKTSELSKGAVSTEQVKVPDDK